MKNTIAIVILFAAATCAPAQDKKEDTATGASQATTIPADAVLNPGGKSYSYTDKDGKKWTYLRTPFGISRVAATEKKPAAAPREVSKVTVVDKGDTVRFERPSPLGPMGYEKKKSELTEEERRIFDSYKADSYKADAHQAGSDKAKTQQNEKTQ